ncbi:MAG: hypothetical protein ACRD96_05585, partial [Bryobacteraceae bacterium]
SRLRLPPYVKIVLDNPFPRSHVTTHVGRAPALYYGPFRSRAAAEQFESRCLDLFQMRRCQEDLEPSPQHPGCIYGEMGMCLRPCQQVVGAAEYAVEVMRVTAFLSTGGRSLIDTVAAARDQLSEVTQFEEAARQHKRLERIDEVLALRDQLACNIDRLAGVAVTPSPEPGGVELRFLLRGFWQPVVYFSTAEARVAVPMDQRLRDIVGAVEPRMGSARRRQEHLAILARWFYSSWRDGEWLAFDSLDKLPYRKLVRMISRVAASRTT